MRIKGITATSGLTTERPYVRLELRDELNMVGIGEATPWPAATLAEIESMAIDLGTALLGFGPFELDEHDLLRVVHDVVSSEGQMFGAMKPARFATETALLDLIGQRLGRSMASCLSGQEPQAEIPCNALLDASVDDLPAKALELAKHGYSAIKVKLRARDNVAFAREVSVLREMRRVWQGELRLDPNGRWSIDEARNKLEMLADLTPRYVEQPVAVHDLVALGKTACPWAADESLLEPGLPEQLLETGACSAFILKPALLGGLLPAWRLAKLGRAAGIDVVTTHALDGPVGIAAACEFARALPGPSRACGLDLHTGLSGYPSMKSPHHVRPGTIGRVGAFPGLGFSESDRNLWMA